MNRLYLPMIAACALGSALCSPVQAKYHEPDNTTRVLWDLSSQTTIFSAGNYSRLIPLQDGRLMCVAEWNGIIASYSSDNGKTWTPKEFVIQNSGSIPLAVPDVIQLKDGTIIVGYNPRPSSPYTEDRLFGIRCMRSTDNGKTWEGPIFIYDAHHTFGDGCWEPNFLELPSGELHCYFANEKPFTQSDEQEITLCRSFDGGKTWSEGERVCFRAGHRDGMPVSIITDAGEIVVIVEDNGFPGGFRATTVRCSLEQNWHDCWVDANSDRRHVIWADGDQENMGYLSAAPYIRKLPTGETIASWQGYHWGRPSLDMFVAVGDKDARNFTQVSQPFKRADSDQALWNSINLGLDNTVIALGSLSGPNEGAHIDMLRGHLLTGIEAAYGTPKINGTVGGESWTRKLGQQLFLGAIESRQRATVDFLYDVDNLYVAATIIDPTIFTDKIDNDGLYVYIDTKNACDTYPQEGTYRIFFNTNGDVEWAAGGSNHFTKGTAPEGVEYVVKVNKTYFTIEAAIPWSALGCESVPVEQQMRLNVAVRDRRSGALIEETIPQTTKNASWTWLPFNLIYDERAGVEKVAEDSSASVPAIRLEGRTLAASSAAGLQSVEAYTADGRLAGRVEAQGCTDAQLTIATTGVVVVRAVATDGAVATAKFVVD